MVKLPSQMATWLSPKGRVKKQSLYSKHPRAWKTKKHEYHQNSSINLITRANKQTNDPQTGEQLLPKNFSHCCKSSRAHNRFLYMHVQQNNWEFPGNLTLSRELPRDWGNRHFESTTEPCMHQGPRRKEQWPHKRLSQTCLWVSIHRKVLNSVGWHIWLSLINSNLWMFLTTCPFFAKILYILGPPCLLGAILSWLLEILSSRFEVLKIPTK